MTTYSEKENDATVWPDLNPAAVRGVRAVIVAIRPGDALEQTHIEDALAWVDSGAMPYRVRKPATPDKHLVSYFVVFDPTARKVLLVDHKKAELWLPSGGHIELNEDPKETVRRECIEELGIPAQFYFGDPFFLTVTKTRGMMDVHTDVSFWYVLVGDHRVDYAFDPGEFHGIRWFGLDEIPLDRADPHMGRFIRKLKGMV